MRPQGRQKLYRSQVALKDSLPACGVRGERAGLVNASLSDQLFLETEVTTTRPIENGMNVVRTNQSRALPKAQPEARVAGQPSAPALTRKEYQEFQQQFAQSKAKYGVDRVKAEANRRPEPNDPGRPRVWDQRQLFTLWLIVQTFFQDEPNIDKVCQSLAKDLPHLFSTGERVRRLFYEAEAELDKYEETNAFVIDEDTPRTLKERLFGYTEMLSTYELLQFDLSLAQSIVFYELSLDGVYRCPCGKIHPPPIHLPELNWASQHCEVRERRRKK